MMSRTQHTAHKHAVTLVAVFALLGQALFPHVHAWHWGGAPVAPAAHVERCTTECPTSLTTSAARDAGGHTDRHTSSCPLCRAQNDARSLLLPPSFAAPLPAAAPSAFVTAAISSIASVVRSPAAPRAPPLAS